MRAATADLSPALRASQLSYATIEESATFLTNHVSQFASIDFFTVPTATFRLLFVFVVLSHARGRIVHMNVTAHPTVEIRRTGRHADHVDTCGSERLAECQGETRIPIVDHEGLPVRKPSLGSVTLRLT